MEINCLKRQMVVGDKRQGDKRLGEKRLGEKQRETNATESSYLY